MNSRSIRIFLIQRDIPKLRVDAIVNSANSLLMGGVGVDSVIHRDGGSVILSECHEIEVPLLNWSSRENFSQKSSE